STRHAPTRVPPGRRPGDRLRLRPRGAWSPLPPEDRLRPGVRPLRAGQAPARGDDPTRLRGGLSQLRVPRRCGSLEGRMDEDDARSPVAPRLPPPAARDPGMGGLVVRTPTREARARGGQVRRLGVWPPLSPAVYLRRPA